ncbi:chaperonin 10-like protein [Fusarium flagelliforme]|uniref:chaperonin 10-like protein n=1 Tax=Fusarium flagelliforme TaxID=2675880 RepID=UPI001E8DA26D|nr:chaperonin 10-like protein [Fusarium flagelliforme]KAH7196568.1 chaperonin 10-like protein [Fusarium flagelliforme]
MSKLTSTTQTLVAPKKCLPAEYTVLEQPIPAITKPDEVLLKMGAVCINTEDTRFPAGQLNILIGDRLKYPFPLGMEGSGTVIAVGSDVTEFQVGDKVYGAEYEKPILTRPPAGWCSEYVVTEAKFLHKKPDHIAFEEAAALPALTVVAYQTIKRGLQHQGRDDLAGQTVYIPAALSGTGSLMIQVAKNFFGAEKIISTVSTPKMGLVEKHLPGLVNQLYDYKTQNVVNMVGRGTVDFAISTQFSTLNECISVLKPEGILMSIASAPKSDVMLEMLGPKLFPAWLGWVLNTFQWWYSWKLRGTNIKYEFLSGNPGILEDMKVVEGMIKDGKVRGIFNTVDFGNLEDVKRACDKVLNLKGDLGKLVIRM